MLFLLRAAVLLALAHWWRAQSTSGCPVWPGIATECIGPARLAQEIADQIALTRRGTAAPVSAR